MAQGTISTGLIEKIQINNETQQRIASTAYGICSTLADRPEKIVQIDGFELIDGVTIHVKFIHDNTASSPPTLNVNGTGAINIVQYDNVAIGTSSETSGWQPGAVLSLTYDGTYWVRDQGYNTNTTYSTLTQNEVDIGTNTTGKLISAKVIKDTIDDAFTAATDTKVAQTGVNNDNKEYPILFKNTDDTVDETASIKYNNDINKLITINPSTGIITAVGFNGSGADLTNIPYSSLNIPNNSIPNNKLVNSSIEVASRIWNLGDTITAANLRSDLGLSNAIHFIGKVASDSQYTPSDGLNQIPAIADINSYTPSAGDVVIDANDSREYIYTSGNTWELLGQDASTTYTISLNPCEYITSITQSSDRLINITKAPLSISANQILMTSNPSENETMNIISRAYKDVTSATAISVSTNFITERAIYYGLPTINNSHSYTSATELYMPISAGTANHILISGGGINAPIWSEVATLESNISSIENVAAYDTLTLGNDNNIATTDPHSQGCIHLYSSGIYYTGILSQASSNQNFYLPLYAGDMYAAHTGGNTAVGNTEHPVYVALNGRITETTYGLSATIEDGTANRLAFYSGNNLIEATEHYASSNKIGINYINGEPTANLYVNGTTYFNGNVTHNGIIYLANDTTYYIDNSAVGYLPDFRVDKIRLDDDLISFYGNNNAAGNRYGYIQVSDGTYMYFVKENGNNGFNFNGNLIPSATNMHDIGTSLLRWKDLYLEGNLIMQDMGSSNSYPNLSNKITWSGEGDSAEIYYEVEQYTEGRLVFNTKADTNCLMALAYNDDITAYFNNSTPSFYPVIPVGLNCAGTLGLPTNRWGTLYLGTQDTYGDPYQSIYWNNGVPEVTYPVQYFTWNILSGNYGVTLNGTDIFKDNTYNITLVITSGEEYLNSPLTWTSSTNPDQFTITTDIAVSGNVSGYAIVARGTDITSSITATQIVPI